MPVLRTSPNGVEFVGRHSIQIFQNKAHAPLRFEFVAVAIEKIPIEHIKWTGIVTIAIAVIVATRLTVIAHLVHIVG